MRQSTLAPRPDNDEVGILRLGRGMNLFAGNAGRNPRGHGEASVKRALLEVGELLRGLAHPMSQVLVIDWILRIQAWREFEHGHGRQMGMPGSGERAGALLSATRAVRKIRCQ